MNKNQDKGFLGLTNMRSLLQASTKKTIFKIRQTKENIWDQLWQQLHYIMEYILCIKQYVGMAETSFNISKIGIISTNEESLLLSISYQILSNIKKIWPSGLWKEKTFGFYHHMRYTQKVPTWTVLNNINNKHNRKL